MDRAYLVSIATVSDVTENVKVNNYNISLLFLGMNGMYAVVENENPNELQDIFSAIKSYFHVQDNQLQLFLVDDVGTGYYFDYLHGPVKFDDFYDAFEKCYENHLIPQTDLFHIELQAPSDYCREADYEFKLNSDYYEGEISNYVAPVISDGQIDRIVDILISLQEEPYEEGKYRIHPDGAMEIKRITTKSVYGVSTFIENGFMYFPCMDMDGDKFYLLTVLGGWFGLHLFKVGSYLRGLGYLLTGGCFGVFYILDLLAIITGTFSYTVIRTKGVRERYYSRPVTDKKKAALLLFLALVIAVFVTKYVYLAGFEFINAIVSNSIATSDVGMSLAEVLQESLQMQ